MAGLFDNLSNIFKGVSESNKKTNIEMQKLEIEKQKVRAKEAEVQSKILSNTAKDSLIKSQAEAQRTKSFGEEQKTYAQKIANMQQLDPSSDPQFQLAAQKQKADEGFNYKKAMNERHKMIMDAAGMGKSQPQQKTQSKPQTQPKKEAPQSEELKKMIDSFNKSHQEMLKSPNASFIGEVPFTKPAVYYPDDPNNEPPSLIPPGFELDLDTGRPKGPLPEIPSPPDPLSGFISYRGVDGLAPVQQPSIVEPVPPPMADVPPEPAPSDVPPEPTSVDPMADLPVDPANLPAAADPQAIPELPTPNLPEVRAMDLDIKRAAKERMQYADMMAQSIPEVQRANERIRSVQNAIKESNDKYKEQMLRVNSKREQLAKNPATFQNALSNLNFGQRIASIFHLVTTNPQYGNPAAVLDQYIAEELHDLKAKNKAQGNYLDSTENLYKQFYEIDKDEASTDLSVEAALRENVLKTLDMQSKVVDNEEALLKLESLKQSEQQKLDLLKRKEAMEIYKKQSQFAIQKLKLSGKGTGGLTFDQSLKLSKFQLDREDKLRERSVQGLKVAKGQKNPIERVKFDTKDDADVFKKEVKESRTQIGFIKELDAAIKDYSFKDVPGAKISDWSQGVIKTRGYKDYQRVNKVLEQLKLQARIAFTGGGNVSEYEQKMLKDYFAVGGPLDVAKAKRLGEYDILMHVIMKTKLNAVWASLENSNNFQNLSRADKIKLVAQKSGVSDTVALKSFNTTYKSRFERVEV